MKFLFRTGVMPVLFGALLLSSLAGCACRPGHVGPYGGIHPARCWIF